VFRHTAPVQQTKQMKSAVLIKRAKSQAHAPTGR
jgi:hypothetical protein